MTRRPSFPDFDRHVPYGGYAWWYVDALSDDGHDGLTLIAFVGSVFSPYYARARRRGAGDPLDHCALNVALYGRSRRWALTERGRGAVARTADSLAIGPSSLRWDGGSLAIAIDEITVPRPSRLRGTVRLHPAALTDAAFALDAAGNHAWRPLAPCARIDVDLTRPALRWSGTAYFDANSGNVPLETAFAGWHWSRARAADGTAVLYEVTRRDGSVLTLAKQFDRDGSSRDFAAPPIARLPVTHWRIARSTRADAGHAASVIRTLEDAPFYARSLVSTRLQGVHAIAMHESLALARFRAPWVRMLLPFRMPRVSG